MIIIAAYVEGLITFLNEDCLRNRQMASYIFMKQVTFYFDFLSPFSYFAWKELSALGTVEIILKPVALGPLLNHWGIKGPGEVKPKREFLLKQCLRYSRKNNIPFTTPKTHPFNSLYALRLCLYGVAQNHQYKVIDTLWRAGWQDRIDMGDPDELLRVLREASLPANDLYEKSFTREAKAELKANITEAISNGVFGVPSFVVNGELFWGKDSMDELKLLIQGDDNLDREKLKLLLDSTPRAASQSV